MKEYKHIKDSFNRMKAERAPWDVVYQVIGEYLSQVKQNFTGEPAQGEFLTNDVFDSTGIFAAYNSASAILGMLWPGTAKQSIDIQKPDDMQDSTELVAFYKKLNERAVNAIDDPKAGLILALDEYMLDQVIFGISGVGVEKGFESKLLFKPYGVPQLYIDEGRNRNVDKLAMLYEWTVERVVEEYGIDKVSEKTRKKFEGNKTNEKVKVLHFIQRRKMKKATKGKLAMDYESIHLEYDTCHLLREDGFAEFPVAVCRLRKTMYEKYGRGFGMTALPDIREANVLREAISMATEKALNMPMGVIDEGILGGGYIDTSANAVTVFKAAGNIGNTPPVFEIGKVPEIKNANELLENLKNTISQHFNIDRLIDFNNEVQMTFGEAQIRDQIRTASLSGLFGRQIAELFTVLLTRGVNILWRGGEFGVVPGSVEEEEAMALGKEIEYFPDEIVKRLKSGKDVYKIVYKTKAANASRAEEYMGILDTLAVTKEIYAVDPDIINRIDTGIVVKKIASIRGTMEIIRQDDAIAEIEKKQQQQQEAQRTMEMAAAGAEVSEKSAKAQALMGQQ